jgi:hypothetical protein
MSVNCTFTPPTILDVADESVSFVPPCPAPSVFPSLISGDPGCPGCRGADGTGGPGPQGPDGAPGAPGADGAGGTKPPTCLCGVGCSINNGIGYYSGTTYQNYGCVGVGGAGMSWENTYVDEHWLVSSGVDAKSSGCSSCSSYHLRVTIYVMRTIEIACGDYPFGDFYYQEVPWEYRLVDSHLCTETFTSKNNGTLCVANPNGTYTLTDCYPSCDGLLGDARLQCLFMCQANDCASAPCGWATNTAPCNGWYGPISPYWPDPPIGPYGDGCEATGGAWNTWISCLGVVGGECNQCDPSWLTV